MNTPGLFSIHLDSKIHDELMVAIVHSLQNELDDSNGPGFLNTNDKRAAAQAFIDGMKQVHYGDLSWEPSRRREELNKPGMRQVLESGILDALFIAAKDVGDGSNGPLAELILGAMMMRAGVEIPDAHMARLRELVPHLGCGAYMRDDGTFANPGQAQYLAALDLYKAGTPRSFAEAR